jgi:hypothetical protein
MPYRGTSSYETEFSSFGKWQVQNFPNATVLGQQVFDHLSQAILLDFPQESAPHSPVCIPTPPQVHQN